MDPLTRKIYTQDEIANLPKDVQQRLIRGELEELRAISEDLAIAQAMTQQLAWNKAQETGNRAARRASNKRLRAAETRHRG